MLVLSRKVNENIVIDGRIIVKVVRTEGNFVKLGIEAPADVPVHRQEVYDEIQRNNQAALTSGRPVPPRLPAAKAAEKSAAPKQPKKTSGGSDTA
jgi:carbon storage regulator